MCSVPVIRDHLKISLVIVNSDKGFSIMCKFAHVKKFNVVTLTWNLYILY